MSSIVRCPRCKRPRRVEVANAFEAVDPLGGCWAGPMPSFQCANGCGTFVVLSSQSTHSAKGKTR